MPFSEAVRLALGSLRANKLRSFLTVLGILIGVSSVIAVVAITSGLDRYIAERVLELGSKSFSIQKMPDIITSAQQWIDMQRRKDVTMDDIELVKRSCDLCSEVGAMVATSANVKVGRVVQRDVRVMGVTENYSRIGSIRDLEAGRHLIDEDVDNARNSVVIGADLADAFFGTMEPIGREITIDSRPYHVVGVASRKGSIFGESQDNFVWMPISLFRKEYGTRRSIVIQVEARSMQSFEDAQDQARVAMRVRRHLEYEQPDDFNIETGESILDLWKSATQGIYIATFLVTAISLVVGGVVVMNIMLVSVTERTSEIGVRKALGAKRRDIVRQFLVEAVVLSGLGGVLGVAGAALFAQGLGIVLGRIMEADFVAPVQPWAVALAVVASSAVGLVAGLYPASRAAALDPVIALRAE
jgi:putative ABC transport system permease protein